MRRAQTLVFTDATERDAYADAGVGDFALIETGPGTWRWNGAAWVEAIDPTAIHVDVASEISAITAKATPVSGDFLVIEDAADANNKKRITLGSLPAAGGAPQYGTLTTTTIATAPVGLWNLDGDALDASGNGNNGTKVNDSEYIALGGRRFLHIPNVGVGTPGYIDVAADAAFQLDGDMSCFVAAASLNGFSTTGFLVNCGDVAAASDPDRELHSLYMTSSIPGYPSTRWKRSALTYSSNGTLTPTTVDRGCSFFTVGYVRDATANTIKWFYNGAEVETQGGKLPPTPGQGGNNGLTLGANFGGASPWNGGILGSAALWAAKISAADMRALDAAIRGGMGA